MSFKDFAKTENALKDGPGSKPTDAPPTAQPLKERATESEGPPARKP